MDVEEEYLDILQNIEFAIMSVYRDNPLLVDFDVEAAINALISLYHAQSQSHEARRTNLNERATLVYERVEAMCDWRLGREGPRHGRWIGRCSAAGTSHAGRDRCLPEAYSEVRPAVEQRGRAPGVFDVCWAFRSVERLRLKYI